MSRRFQFSIRFLLLATVAVAAGAAAARAERSLVTGQVTQCLSVLFATAAIIGVYETAGRIRVFWIGAAIVLCPLAFYAVQISVSLWRYWEAKAGVPAAYFDVWPGWCAAPINGLFAVLLHWLVAPRETRY